MKLWPAMFHSLRARIIFSVVIIEVVMLSILVGTSLATLRGSHMDRLQETARNLVQLFADTSARYLVAVDYETLEQYARKVRKQRELTYVVVEDMDGRPVVEMGQTPSPLPAQDPSAAVAEDGIYDVAADIMLADKRRGRVFMGFSLAGMEATLQQARNRSLVIAGTEILLSILAALAIGYGLTRRLDQLVRGTEAVVEGRYSQALPEDGPQEVRRLTRGFNSMQQTIKNRIAALGASEERFRSLVDNLPDGVFSLDLEYRIRHASPAALAMFSFSRISQLVGTGFPRLFPEDRRGDLLEVLRRASHGEVVALVLNTGSRGGSKERWFDMVFSPARDADGAIVSLLASVRDVTESRAQAAVLERLSFHDALTDLPNRVLFLNHLEARIIAARMSGQTLAVVVMDLDRFKEVNDTLGHNVGDQLLKEVAVRIGAVAAPDDFIARLGGDEFAVLIRSVTEPEALDRAYGVLNTLEEKIPLPDLDVHVGASIGIALFAKHGSDAASLVRRAEVAMYQAKRERRGVVLYTPETDPHSLRRLALYGELREAIDAGELFLHFQPTVGAGERRVVGAEALVRWNHPRHGMLPPLEFIPLAEDTGLIQPLTRWVLNEALRHCARWKAEGFDGAVSVNLSARNLVDAGLVDTVSALLQEWAVPARCLKLEITESDIMEEPDLAMRVLTRLDEMGVKLSIDDFGTGYSSLAYLKQLPVDEIKIDRSFVIGMEHDDNDAMIVHATIDLAHNLGLKVVGEGVENEHVADLLDNLGCDALQGYYTGRPMSFDDLMACVDTTATAMRRGDSSAS